MSRHRLCCFSIHSPSGQCLGTSLLGRGDLRKSRQPDAATCKQQLWRFGRQAYAAGTAPCFALDYSASIQQWAVTGLIALAAESFCVLFWGSALRCRCVVMYFRRLIPLCVLYFFPYGNVAQGLLHPRIHSQQRAVVLQARISGSQLEDRSHVQEKRT